MAVNDSRKPKTLPVLCAAEIKQQLAEDRWLIRDLWSHQAVGIVGGCPKSAKTWFGLDMATSVASGTPCLGRFPVENRGRALVYLAEDSLPLVRARIESICSHRSLDIKKLDLHVIASTSLRLDLHGDQQRLQATIERLRPRVLLLDPLVRLHRLDEDRASDISGLLGYLRELQRAHDLAVVLVHHAGKKHYANPGQAVRGSSDLHAWSDSAAYLVRKNEHLTLTIEHRSAPSPGPYTLHLTSRPEGSATHLEVISEPPPPDRPAPSLADSVLELLCRSDKPLYRSDIRSRLRVNNHRLGEALEDLERKGAARRTPNGWEPTQPLNTSPQDNPGQLHLHC